MNHQDLLVAADAYLAATRPVLAVPRASPLPEMAESGERMLVAQDGLYIGFSRPWIAGAVAVARTAGPAQALAAYGKAGDTMTLKCGPVPMKLIKSFIRLARLSLPNEYAAWITWDENLKGQGGAWQLIEVAGPHATPSKVEINRPVLPEGVHLVVDIHSHGAAPAFFSRQDDEDDRMASEVKISLVVGSLETEQGSIAARLCACGQFMDIPFESVVK
jgi:PRTRC genetic system protein A